MQASTEAQSMDTMEDTSKMRAVLGLRQIVSMHSPCAMLTLLVDVIKSMATYDEHTLNPL